MTIYLPSIQSSGTIHTPWKKIPLFLVGVLLAVGLLLSGCKYLSSSSDPSSTSGTPVPTPTRDPSGYQVVTAEACEMTDMATAQSNSPQGNLVAFQPGSQNIAYLTPTDRTSWYVGTLTLLKAPDYQTAISLAPNVLVAGDLSWSPAGTRLAFLAYRPSENLYTVMTVQPDGKGLTDLFPTDSARTDARTSQKAIIQWKDETTLEVMVSCGEECRKAYDMSASVSAASGSLVPTTVADYRSLLSNLQLHPNLQTYNPEQFPKSMPTPNPAKTTPTQNWSPDNKLVAYIDKRGYPWMLSIQNKIMYPLDIGLRDVYEIEWSADSRAVALRAEDRIFLFQIPCQKK